MPSATQPLLERRTTHVPAASPRDRAGRYVRQPTGYRAFVPAPLPPDPPIRFDGDLLALLSRADQALGRLDGVAQTLPNPDLFVAMYVRREAVFSSQIEGTQSTLEDLLAFELDPRGLDVPRDVEEVVNYVRAMNHGLERLVSLPLSLRLIREIHAELLRDVRGADRRPGEFRTTQNWIGAGGTRLTEASFVPPAPADLPAALDDFERFLHDDSLPALVQCGLAHAQFETIHPFLDGNGRVGRLLITFLLVHRSVLHRPLLYLSLYLKRHRAEYYDRLTAIREDGDWEGWLAFFLRGVGDTAHEATEAARRIVDLREQHRATVQARGLGVNGLRLLDLMLRRPVLNVNLVKDSLAVTFRTAGRLVEQAESAGLLREVTSHRRNRRFVYEQYLGLFGPADEADPEPTPLQTTATGRTAARVRHH
jgi:Fic family protein